MFNKTRKKIIALIMASLILLLAITLCVIYVSSFNSVKRQNEEMLSQYTKNYSLEHHPDGETPPEKPYGTPLEGEKKPPLPEERRFNLSTFHSVAFSQSGEVIRIDNGKSELISDEELVETAAEILSRGETSGVSDNLMYMTSQKPNCTLVAFMDNTLTDSSMDTLLKYILISGIFSIAVMFFISSHLAKRIVKPLEENDIRQKQFVSDAGHELKTPISVIGANAELLSREIGQNEWLSNIQYENEQMRALVTSLLDLSHAENAEMPLEEVDFSRLVTGEILPFESLAFEKGFLIKSDISENIFVWGNNGKLRRLVLILLDNAIRHSGPKAKEIEIRLEKLENKACLTVSNFADEISEEQLERIFERFYRVDEVRNSSDKHYGLGLSIAKAIVEAHKGEIKAEYLEGKVIFTVTLPLKK